MRRIWFLPAAVGIILCSAGCSSGPSAPQPGTPEFIWSAAKTTYAAGDYIKADDNLSQLAKGTSEFAVRSRPLAIVLTSGIAKAYVDLADNFEAGAKANRGNPTPFRRQVNLFRSQASSAAMQTAEAVHEFFQSNPPDSVPLALGYPSGSAAEPVSLQRVAKGMILPDAEIETLQKEMIQRSVLLAMTRAVGAGEDTAKSLEILKGANATVAKPVFALETAKVMLDLADLYSPKQLDEPNRLSVLTGEIDEVLQAAPAGKDTKDAAAKLSKLKKGKSI
jgi:hypothetical protein